MEKKHPGLISKGKSLAGAVVRVAQRKVSGGRVLVTDEEFDYRMNFCMNNMCGNLDELNLRCFVCGCYLKPKLSLTTEECPMGFWPVIEL